MISNERNILTTKCTVLLGALVAVAILTCLGTAAYALDTDRGSKMLLPERMRIFDPFMLTTIAAVESGSGSPGSGVATSGSDSSGSGTVLPLATRPPIRIGVRPLQMPSIRIPIRCPYRTASKP